MALSAPPPHPRGLPAETTSFVGRRREHDQVRRLLSGARLVTLCGVGGVGKTRLALQVARSPGIVVEEVWFVDLTALTDPGGLPQTVAVALGIGGESAKSSAAVLADYLAPRRLLLVLDNCEHLLRSCGEMVQMLLQTAPGLHVLATSTQPLGLTAEHTLVVPPLASLDLDGFSDPSEVEASDAVVLMIDRARAVLSGGPGESHPRAPTDPGVTVSRHRALVALVTGRRGPKESIPSARTCEGTFR